MWPLLCHTDDLQVTKIQQCPQVFNLPFKINLYLLDQALKKQEKGRKSLESLSSPGHLFYEIHVA